jgi:hypothetical protein
MGNAAGLKAWQVLGNVEWTLAIELLAWNRASSSSCAASPAVALPPRTGSSVRASPRLMDDRQLAGGEMRGRRPPIRDGSFVAAVEDELGGLQ